jgi:tRNA (guanine37-N1)-methyltransferase
MNFHVITIFPKLFDSYINDSIMKRAIESGKISVQFYNPRDVTKNKHNKVDDIPYGGGPGMIMMAEPIIDIWSEITKRTLREKLPLTKKRKFKTILLSPGGKKFTTEYAKSTVSEYTDIIFICGRYEGIDSRVEQITGAELISIGDYVLTGGELAAMVMIDSLSRQIDGVLGNSDSLEEERISSHEMYTRPAELIYKGKKYNVPKVLTEGNHKLIDEWRKNH